MKLEKAAPKNVLYLASGASFRSDKPGRKIHSVVKCFKDMGYWVRFIAGGDILPGGNAGRGGAKALGRKGAGYKIHLPDALYHSISEYRDMKRDRLFSRYLRLKLKDYKPDLIWERSWRLQKAGLELAADLGIPYILEWKDHLTNYPISLFKGKAESLETRKLKKARWVVVESTKLKNVISKEEGLDPDKFLVALNGVDIDEFGNVPRGDHSRNKLSLPQEAFVVGYVGSFAWYHDIELLVQTAAFLKYNNLLDSFLFVMVGDGGTKAKVEQIAEDRGLESHFRFTGRVPMEDVPHYLAAFDCAVLPGCTDIICPIKVSEYMAAGLAVVIPDYEPNREIIFSGENGLLFVPKDARSMSEKMLYLKNNPESKDRIGNQARETAAENLTWEGTWGTALKKILEEV